MEEDLLDLEGQLNNLQKENRLRMINDILFSTYEIVSTIKVTLDQLKFDGIYYEISDKMVEEIVTRVKYDLKTLERYL